MDAGTSSLGTRPLDGCNARPFRRADAHALAQRHQLAAAHDMFARISRHFRRLSNAGMPLLVPHSLMSMLVRMASPSARAHPRNHRFVASDLLAQADAYTSCCAPACPASCPFPHRDAA